MPLFAAARALLAGFLVAAGPPLAEAAPPADHTLIWVAILSAVTGITISVITGIFSLLTIRASRRTPDATMLLAQALIAERENGHEAVAPVQRRSPKAAIDD